MNIIDAIKDPKLFRTFLADGNDSIHSWRSWLAALRVLYGLPLTNKSRNAIIEQCKGRSIDSFTCGFDSASNAGVPLNGRLFGPLAQA